jgi:hypothetical protein
MDAKLPKANGFQAPMHRPICRARSVALSIDSTALFEHQRPGLPARIIIPADLSLFSLLLLISLIDVLFLDSLREHHVLSDGRHPSTYETARKLLD